MSFARSKHLHTQDVNFTGGVIHIIDSVLTIPESVSATATAARLSSLAGALVEAKLADALDELQNVTIFVPSNDAFQSIGSALEDIDEDTLAAILQCQNFSCEQWSPCSC